MVECRAGDAVAQKLVSYHRSIQPHHSRQTDGVAHASVEDTQKLAASCAVAIDQVHDELHEDIRATKRATAHGLRQLHAATSASLSEVYKATKASCDMA